MTISTLNKGRFGAQYDWNMYGAQIAREYTNGESPLTLSDRYRISKGAIANYLGRLGIRRTKKQAKLIERKQGKKRRHNARACKICANPYVPKSPNQRYCKECIPNNQARQRFLTKNVTQKEWEKILNTQESKCALCERPATDLDHDHKTLIIRGALCGGCNQALNRQEDPKWVARASQYLTRDTGHRVLEHAQARLTRSARSVVKYRQAKRCTLALP